MSNVESQSGRTSRDLSHKGDEIASDTRLRVPEIVHTLTNSAEQTVEKDGEPSEKEKGAAAVTDSGVLHMTTTEEGHVYLTGWKLQLVLFAVTVTAFCMLLDTSIIVTAIPRITSDFNSLNDVGWYGASYLLASAALLPLAGKLYTHYSSKYVFLSYLAVFELGSLLCGVSVNSKMLIVSRAVAGIGSSGILNGAFTIIHATLPMVKVPLYMGVLTGCAQLGILFGPILGGVLTQYTTWRWCFYINLPIGGLVAPLLFYITIPDRTVVTTTKLSLPQHLIRLDIPGFLLFAPSAIQLLLALQWGGITHPWASATILGLLLGSLATFCLFLLWESHTGAERAMIPLSMLRRRIVAAAFLTMLPFYGNLFTVTYYLPIYFQSVRGDSPTTSSVNLLPSILGVMSCAILSGALVGRFGYYLPFAVVGPALAAIGSGLLSTLTPTTNAAHWAGYQFLGGAGRGMMFQVSIVAIQNDLPKELVPIGTSLIVFSQTMGGAIFLSIAQTLFSQGLRKYLPIYAPDVNVAKVIEAGATAIREVVKGPELAGVLLAYNKAISHTQYLGAATAVACFFAAWGLGWRSVKEKKVVQPEA